MLRLTSRDTDLVLKELPKMLDTCVGIDLFNSHGATLGTVFIISKFCASTLKLIVKFSFLNK